MDEPYAALDKNLADNLILENKRIHRQLKQTTIHVTHNQEEAATLADRIAIIHNGEIKMIGTPDQIFKKPNCDFVAEFVCTENIFNKMKVTTDSNGNCFLVNNGRRFAYDKERIQCKNSREVTVCVRPENVVLHGSQPNKDYNKNIFKGVVKEVFSKSLTNQIIVDTENNLTFTSISIRNSGEQGGFKSGDAIYVAIDDVDLHVYE
jgi:ABC-type Fe3+/spermidine/putrescine transport system ATPase subunit